MNENIPYVVYEGTQVRYERTLKRLITALIIAIMFIFASNVAWLIAWCQYDYTSTQKENIVEQNADDGGNANYIGESGEITNGLSKSNETDKYENTP